MAQSRERHAEYMRQRRLNARNGLRLRQQAGEYEGVNPPYLVSVSKDVNPDSKKESVNPVWFPMIDMRRRYQVRFMDYILSLNEGGMRLVRVAGVFGLAPMPLADVERRLMAMEAALAIEKSRNTMLEADLARLDAMISSMMAEDTRDGL